ncbi:flagellar hook-associated protein FlgL [Sporosarcina gallistercoris]|uniref:Flagellar hook-associated protein FlgL n=1 Tax=Sporosarcina gallistercoris TaxID=2762245 RepID=A0ABR8PN45_9BACL|nr:flagellar hook-associated protein FlgL [Sporosarcina gallistercoris]MBD7909603.1 flagellar hook-associated protein FlgL [Sporosarcina gallistercoris]
MRVTQSMLSNNMLRNLTSSYSKMGKLNDQLTTGKKVNRPSDDPVVAMRGLNYRMQVDKVAQYQRNIGEVNNWLDSTDDALDKVGQALHRTKELVTNAANTGAMTDSDREKIKSELDQLRQQIQDTANTKVGDKYIFSGTKTGSALYDKTLVDDGNGNMVEKGYPEISTDTDPAGALTAFESDVNINVFDGVQLNVNSTSAKLFKDIEAMFKSFDDPSVDFGEAIGKVDGMMDDLLTERADVGARQNRAELMDDRLETQEGISKKQMSLNEDIDYEKVITEMISQESVHRAALSVGARIIQPSLVDFLR